MGRNNHLDKILSNSSLTSVLKEWRMLINFFHLCECISSAEGPGKGRPTFALYWMNAKQVIACLLKNIKLQSKIATAGKLWSVRK